MCVCVCVGMQVLRTKNVKLYVGWQVEVAAAPVELSGRVRVAQQFAYKKGC